jgi:CRISPR system Cascade subunit CasC
VPLSLANAFEEPVKPGPGFIKPSVKVFHDYWQTVHVGYGLSEKCAQFALGHEPPAGMKGVKTLEELKAWVRNNGEG